MPTDLPPIDVINETMRLINDRLTGMRKEAYDVAVLLSAKPKGKMRELTKKANEMGDKIQKEEDELKTYSHWKKEREEYDAKHAKKAK